MSLGELSHHEILKLRCCWGCGFCLCFIVVDWPVIVFKFGPHPYLMFGKNGAQRIERAQFQPSDVHIICKQCLWWPLKVCVDLSFMAVYIIAALYLHSCVIEGRRLWNEARCISSKCMKLKKAALQQLKVNWPLHADAAVCCVIANNFHTQYLHHLKYPHPISEHAEWKVCNHWPTAQLKGQSQLGNAEVRRTSRSYYAGKLATMSHHVFGDISPPQLMNALAIQHQTSYVVSLYSFEARIASYRT